MKSEEQIDVDEFGWYETWLIEEETGISCIIIVTGQEAYLDNLGPRLRLKITEFPYSYDMLPIFLNNPTNPGIPSKLYNNIITFIELNKLTLIKFWNNQSIDYTSLDVSGDIIAQEI